MHVTCSVGACGFWESVVDEDGEEETLTEELVGELAGLHM